MPEFELTACTTKAAPTQPHALLVLQPLASTHTHLLAHCKGNNGFVGAITVFERNMARVKVL